jgi:hypothetical protein
MQELLALAGFTSYIKDRLFEAATCNAQLSSVYFLHGRYITDRSYRFIDLHPFQFHSVTSKNNCKLECKNDSRLQDSHTNRHTSNH